MANLNNKARLRRRFLEQEELEMTLGSEGITWPEGGPACSCEQICGLGDDTIVDGCTYIDLGEPGQYAWCDYFYPETNEEYSAIGRCY